jgi:DNA repair protein RAD7
MEVDEGEATPAKKRKLTKAAEAKLKAKEKKKKGKKGSDDEYDEDDDAYTALSKSMWTNGASKPPVGSFDNCAVCGKQFTVVRAMPSFSRNLALLAF